MAQSLVIAGLAWNLVEVVITFVVTWILIPFLINEGIENCQATTTMKMTRTHPYSVASDSKSTAYTG